MQVPEHVTRRQACDQKFFRVVAGFVAAEPRVTRSRNGRLSVHRDHVVPPVAGVSPGALAVITSPLQLGSVGVLLQDSSLTGGMNDFICRTSVFQSRPALAARIRSAEAAFHPYPRRTYLQFVHQAF